MPTPRVRRAVVTRPPVTTFEVAAGPGGALGAYHITTGTPEACDALIRRLRLAPLPPGAVALRELADADRAIAARPTRTAIVLTPHAGRIVTARIARWLERAGVAPAPADPLERYPETRDLVEACMLDALASAASPLAIDALLRQPDLWRASGWHRSPERSAHPQQLANHDRVLNRLLSPPLVVAIGHTNIGKSTLVNALARRTVALAADLPGTTRDHVGVTLDLAGLVVRWIDTPGIPPADAPTPPDPIDSEARALALDVLARADLVVSCADATAPFLDAASLPIRSDAPVLTCATRADLASPPPASITVAAALDRGLDSLATAIRDTLVPPVALRSPTPWRFHPRLEPLFAAP